VSEQDQPQTKHSPPGRSKLAFLALGLLLLSSVNCKRSPESLASADKPEDAQPAQSAQNKKQAKAVDRPDPLFEQYEYPGSTRVGAITLGTTVSATYRSEHDYDKVVDFYRQKFSGSKQVSVQTGISYFGVANADGSGLTATISPAPDKLTQIILRHDKKQ
jgi:hypothetical protein